MAIDLTDKIRESVARSLGVPADGIYCTQDGDTLVVTATGKPRGQSAKYAARRRQRTEYLANRIAATYGHQVLVAFAVKDAISALESLIRTATELVLGQIAENVDVKVGRKGAVSVQVSLPRLEERASKTLRDAIAPLLRRSGLSLATISVVSPMRSGVADGRILRAAKVLSPCNAAAIARRLRQTDRISIAVDAVHRRLDTLRQKGLLVYLGNRTYALSLRGLATVPSTSRRDSSDVERALALTKRQW